MAKITKWASVKNPCDVQLEGITIEVDMINGSPNSVIITDKFNSIMKVQAGQYSGINVLVPEPPKKVQKFALAGKLLGITPFEELFDSNMEATQRFDEVKRFSNVYEEDVLGLKITSVMVEEDV